MPTALFADIVARAQRELPHIDIVTLSGFGEFLTDADWRQKVSIAGQHFERLHIVTNLSQMGPEDCRFLLTHASDIRVSLYGLDQATYFAVHRPPDSITYQGIHDKVMFLVSRKRPEQRIILNYIELNANRHQTTAWISYWQDKVDLIEVWKPHNWITAKRYRRVSRQRAATCGRPFKGPIQVQVDGTVNVCCFDFNGEMIIGDLRKQSFAEIYDGAPMKYVQRLHGDNEADRLALCRVCDQRNSGRSKAATMIHNSVYPVESRINTTSTEYDPLIESKEADK